MMLSLVVPSDWLSRLLDDLRVDAPSLVRRLVQTLVILLLAWGARRLLHGIALRIERATDDGDPTRVSESERRGRTLAGLIRSIGGVAVAIAAALTVLGLFINVAPLIAGLGVAGLAISFGAQGLVKDVIGGFFIIFENQYRVGDVVRIGGVEGAVERLTLRATVLRDGFGVTHFVPNGQIVVVSNLTRQWSRAVVDVGVTYSANVDHVLAVLREELAQFARDPAWADLVIDEPTVAGVQRLGEGGVDVRVWVNVFPGKQSDAERELRRRIKNRLDAEAIALAVPQRLVRTVSP